MTHEEGDLAWHEALAFAVTGGRIPGLGRQGQPDPAGLALILGGRIGDHLPTRPHPVPAELMAGIGAAQLVAALASLRRELDHGSARSLMRSDRPLTADERRLIGEVPPHHGT